MVSFSKLAGVLAFAPLLAYATELGATGTAEIIAEVGDINTAVESTVAAEQAYTGGIIETLPLIAGILEIHLVNRAVYVEALLISGTATAAESQQIIAYTNATVGQSIPAAVNELIAKEALLTAAGISIFIAPALELLKYDHDTYSAVLLAKVAASELTYGEDVVSAIDDAIQLGITTFSS